MRAIRAGLWNRGDNQPHVFGRGYGPGGAVAGPGPCPASGSGHGGAAGVAPYDRDHGAAWVAPNGPAPALEATNVVRAFGKRRAVDGVSLKLDAGDCLALFGPNGAGKTTLLRLLGGLIRATSGTASIGGVLLPGEAEVRGRVGLISHQTMLYDALTPRENVEFAARMYGVRDVRGETEHALERLGAMGYADRAVRLLSRGMQQRVSVARAVVHRPSVLLADEPFTGLDAAGASALSSMLAELRDAGATMVIVTHNLDEALALCTQAAIMRQGRLVRHDAAPLPSRNEYTALYRELSVDAA